LRVADAGEGRGGAGAHGEEFAARGLDEGGMALG
jgi:hypothetical protein